jgi:hypothetical protein
METHMSHKLLTALMLLFASTASNTYAQDAWGIEVRGGAAFATEDPADVSLATGFGFEGTIAYRFQPHLSVYAGWDWHRFPADGSFAGSNSDFEETGYAFGLLFEHPIGRSEAMAIQLRGGGTYNHIEVENDAGAPIADSGHGLGYEAGVGLAFRLTDLWRVTPGLRFRSLSRDLETGTVTTAADLRYLAVDVGFARWF